ncbi:hypothetical protein Q7P37_009587 [Cladosporium fusiforme]
MSANGPNIDGLAERQRQQSESSESSCPSTKTTSSWRSTSRLIPAPDSMRLLFAQDIVVDRWLEVQLLFMTIITGILDAATFSTYNVFTTKQTGNFLNVALYVFSKEAMAPKVEQNICVSIVSFVLGSLIFGQLAQLVRTRTRGWLISTTFFQAMLVLAAALIEHSGIHGQGTGGRAIAIVGLLSFAQSGQVSLAIGVGLAEVNTTMITGALISTLGDAKIAKKHNHARNRRLLFILCYIVGCFVGASMKFNTDWVFFLAFGLKMLSCTTFLINRGMVRDLEMQDEKPAPVTHILWGD